MSDLPVPVAAPLPAPQIVALPAKLPSLSELFTFMRDAELRFQSLRMQILDHTFAKGVDEATRVDVWLRHPGRSRVVAGIEDGPIRGSYHAWAIDGVVQQHYDAKANVVRTRPVLEPPVGLDRPDLPGFAQVYRPRTRLPIGSVADTFIHPHGLARNVLTTGRLSIDGVRGMTCGREAVVLRCDHPRSSKILVDRPDHWLEVGIDRTLGIILLLAEYLGDRPTRHAEVVSIEPDASVGDEALELHLGPDVRRLY